MLLMFIPFGPILLFTDFWSLTWLLFSRLLESWLPTNLSSYFFCNQKILGELYTLYSGRTWSHVGAGWSRHRCTALSVAVKRSKFVLKSKLRSDHFRQHVEVVWAAYGHIFLSSVYKLKMHLEMHSKARCELMYLDQSSCELITLGAY